MMTLFEQFIKNDMRQDAFLKGYQHARNIVSNVIPELGEEVWTQEYGRIVVTADNMRDVHIDLCFQASESLKSFSQFEVTSSQFNATEYAESLWNAFDDGVADAIQYDIEKFYSK